MITRTVDVEACIKDILFYLGVEATDGTKDTPKRVAEWLATFSNHHSDEEIAYILSSEFELQGYNDLVLVKNISFAGLCEHHLLPFRGLAHVGYIPNKERVVGISKLARLVKHFSHRITMQERITFQIANALEEHLQPQGCMVVMEAEHQCMTLRGVEEPHAETVTSACRGIFLENHNQCRTEFLALVKSSTGGR